MYVVTKNLRSYRTPISIEDTATKPVSASRGETNSRSLRMDIVTGRGYLFTNDDNLKTEQIDPDRPLTGINACVQQKLLYILGRVRYSH